MYQTRQENSNEEVFVVFSNEHPLAFFFLQQTHFCLTKADNHHLHNFGLIFHYFIFYFSLFFVVFSQRQIIPKVTFVKIWRKICSKRCFIVSNYKNVWSDQRKIAVIHLQKKLQGRTPEKCFSVVHLIGFYKLYFIT